MKKEGYHKAVEKAKVSAKQEQRVPIALQRNQKYLLVEQAIEQVKGTLGVAEIDQEANDNLKQVLFIEQAVFVKATAKPDGNIEIASYLYDLRTRGKLSQVVKTVPRGQAESELSSLASNLYLNVDYSGTKVAPKDDLPKQQQARKPIYKTWWFWTAIGGIVAGGVAVTVAVVETRPPSCPDGSSCVRIGE
jgi:hypothetical protein